MKKILVILISLAFGKMTFAQGLENIIVEKYYVSDANDAVGSSGTLPVGSVTYRFFADLATGFKLQAVYGTPGHDLKFISSTTFFNNTDRGASIPNWTKAQAADNTVMLDSYLTIGAATNNNNVPTSQVGILKIEDNGVGTVANANGLLLNNDPSIGATLNTRDGLFNGTLQDVQIAADPATITAINNVFGDVSQASGSFVLSNGSIAAIAATGTAGMSGPTGTNRVFLGQVTTTGTVHYELNLQITNDAGTIVRNYVALNPAGAEQSIPTLKGDLGVTLGGEPTSNGNITFGSVSSSSIQVNLSGGNGAKRLLLIKAGSAVTTNPTDAVTYAANSTIALGDQLGSGNWVIYNANGTGNVVTVTGLTPNTTYHFRAIEYNGAAGGENYLVSSTANASQITSSTGTIYNWNQAGAGPFNYTTPSNWTPARTSLSVDDRLVIGALVSSTSVIDNVPAQTIGTLQIQNNSNVTLFIDGGSSLTINGNTLTSDDFRVDAGSTLTINGGVGSAIKLATNAATANIFGTVNTNTGSSLTGSFTAAVKFKAGSTFATGAGFLGTPFGGPTAVTNSVEFELGSNYIHNGGENPFQKFPPTSIVDFRPGSNQTFNTINGFEVNGRAYRNLTIGAVVNTPLTGTLTLTSLTVSTSGQLTIAGTGSSAINISGGILNNSNNPLSITVGSGNLNILSSGTIGGSGTGSISLLSTPSGAVNVSSGVTLTVTKDINFVNLNLAGSATYKFNASALTASFSGTISGTGSFIPFGNDANFSFTGTGSVGNLKCNGNINNLTINTPATTSTLLSTLRVLGTVTMTDGTLNSNGFLVLRSTPSRQGIISGVGAGNVTGNVTVERYLTASPSKTRYISCPVSGLTTSTAWADDYVVQGLFPYTFATNVALPGIPNAPTIWTYDESNTLPQTPWESAVGQPITNSLVGYATSLHNTSARTLDVVGPVNNGALSNVLPVTNGGWHIVGNPYPSPIRFSLLRNLPGQVGLQNGYYGWSAANNGFGFYNGAVPALSTFGMTDTIFTSQAVAITTNTPAGGTIITDNSIRWGSNAPTFNREGVVKNILKLNVENQFGVDQLAIGTVNGGTENYNPEIDMAKMMNGPTEEMPELGMVIDNRVLAIKAYEKLIPSRSIPLQLIAKNDGVYTFKVAELSNVDNSLNAYLVDVEANKKIQLKSGAKYSVALSNAVYNNRFYLNYENSEVALSDSEVSLNDVDFFNNNESLSIINNGDAVASDVVLFDMSGKLLMQQGINLSKGISTVELPSLAQGIYMVKIQSNNSLVTKKIIIK
jgi:hypothetical protein